MNPEAIEAAAKAIAGYCAADWPSQAYEGEAEAALVAAAPFLIRELALKQMVSMPWFEELVMAEAQAYHSGGNCRFETEARAAELEAAADAWQAYIRALDWGTTAPIQWLRARAAAIRADE